MDLNSKFMIEISKIKDPEIFIGVARILKVRLIEDTKDEEGHFIARSFEEVCADVIETFAKTDRHRKRELFRILQKANEKVKDNASRT